MSVPSAPLNVEIILVSRPRFTDARKLRPSRPWSLNGITLANCHLPICACHQILWHPRLPAGEDSLKLHHFCASDPFSVIRTRTFGSILQVLCTLAIPRNPRIRSSILYFISQGVERS